MQNRCENCKHWFDYGQKVGRCDEIKNKVYVDNSDNYFETDYDFSCNLYVEQEESK